MRISVNLNEDTLKRVDEEARKLGTTRGAMLTAWIGEKIMNLDMSRSLLSEDIPNKIIEALKDGFFEYQMNELSLEKASPEVKALLNKNQKKGNKNGKIKK